MFGIHLWEKFALASAWLSLILGDIGSKYLRVSRSILAFYSRRVMCVWPVSVAHFKSWYCKRNGNVALHCIIHNAGNWALVKEYLAGITTCVYWCVQWQNCFGQSGSIGYWGQRSCSQLIGQWWFTAAVNLSPGLPRQPASVCGKSAAVPLGQRTSRVLWTYVYYHCFFQVSTSFCYTRIVR